jgi:hypothetical protein
MRSDMARGGRITWTSRVRNWLPANKAHIGRERKEDKGGNKSENLLE